MREIACVNAAIPQSSRLKYPPFLFPLCSGTALAIACCSSRMQMYILQSQDARRWGSRLLCLWVTSRSQPSLIQEKHRAMLCTASQLAVMAH